MLRTACARYKKDVLKLFDKVDLEDEEVVASIRRDVPSTPSANHFINSCSNRYNHSSIL